jgi:hypothetical protein
LNVASIEYGISLSTLSFWNKQILPKDKTSLISEKKESCSTNIMGRPKKTLPQTELEQLQVENVELRAEIAYLKK